MTDQALAPESEIPGKPTSASRTTLSHIMTHNDTNLLGVVHGGVIMKLVDDAAGAVAGRHSGGPAGTASMDGMAFLEPALCTPPGHMENLRSRRVHGHTTWSPVTAPNSP